LTNYDDQYFVLIKSKTFMILWPDLIGYIYWGMGQLLRLF